MMSRPNDQLRPETTAFLDALRSRIGKGEPSDILLLAQGLGALCDQLDSVRIELRKIADKVQFS
jgi:hypothetical protein